MRVLWAGIRTASAFHFACAASQATQQPLRTRLMHTLRLTHDDGVSDFADWHAALNNEANRQSLKRVVIESAPYDLYEGRDYDVWSDWEHLARYPAFTGAIDRIKELPNLEDVGVSFSDRARGVENDSRYDEDVELSSTRRHTLQAVFRAMHRRVEENPGFTRVHRLTIENLQNMPLPELTTSAPFKAVMADVTDLHLFVVTEWSEHGPDFDLERVERVTFEPYLQEHWLAPVAHQLTALTLSFDECWATAPGYFDGKGLNFPQLKTLNLRNHAIAHHDHFDWVLRQTSLTRLSLHRCFVTSILKFEPGHVEKWKVRTHDWEVLIEGSSGFNGEWPIYAFNGTWSDVFNKIRTSLVHLESFRFGYSRDSGTTQGFESMESSLHNYRYIVFNAGLLPSPWIEARDVDGSMEFREYLGEYMSKDEYDKPNKAREHADRDGRALMELQRSIAQRNAENSE